MYKVVKKEVLAPNIMTMSFEAPRIAKAAKAGQFVIIRVDETGERVPMGLSGWDTEKGTIDIVFYVLGTTTMKLSVLREGDYVSNLSGPLGKPTKIDLFGTVIVAAGCFGIGPSIPLIEALKDKGNYVITVVEGRANGFVFWEDKLSELSDELHVVLGNGSCMEKGWANDFIAKYLESNKKVDRIFVHGCPFMMMKVSEASLPFGVKTIVSLTPLMVDGTGMCGACRVEVDGVTKLACVDGPDFDGHSINWKGMTLRMRQMLDEEDRSCTIWERDNWHKLVETTSMAF